MPTRSIVPGPLGPAYVTTESASPEPEGPGLFERLFPKRDPMTGEQGGLLANPLFRIGMSLLARSGPSYQPRNFGTTLSGAIADFAQGQMDEEEAAAKFIENQAKRKSWKELAEKDAWAADFPQMVMTANPTGEASALQAKVPDTQVAGTPYHTRLAGLESAGGTKTTNPLNPTVSGIYQFSNDTRKVLDTALGLSPLDRSLERENQRIAEYDKRSAAALKMNGLPTTDANMYATHLLGWGGGPNFIRLAMQSPNTPTSMALSSAILNDNPWLKNKTLGQAYDYIDRSISAGAWAPEEKTAPSPQNLGLFSSVPGKSLALPPAEPPSPPAVAQQVTTPTSAAPGASPQTQAPPPAAGGPTSVSLYGPDGKLSKTAILQTLNSIEPGERNRIILGALAKASGNKREFAENLGAALLARGGSGVSDLQKTDVLLPNGDIRTGSYNPKDGQVYIPDGTGKLIRAPEGTRPTTPGVGAPLSRTKMYELDRSITEQELALDKMDKYLRTVGNTNVGIQRLADQVWTRLKTLFNTGQLTQEQINTAIASGDLQSLVGLTRIDFVGPGVMTKQDAEFVLEGLGGAVDLFQNPNVVRERMKLLFDAKMARLETDIRLYNENANVYGRPVRTIKKPDISKWNELPAMENTAVDSAKPPSKYIVKPPKEKPTAEKSAGSKYQLKLPDGKVVQ